MKRIAWLVFILLLLTATQSAAAFDYELAFDDGRIYELEYEYIPVLEFEKVSLAPGQYLEVYSGPSEAYYRSGNGKAGLSTNDEVFCAGKSGKWMMVEYSKSDAGSRRVGYIETKKLKRVPPCDEICFANIPAVLWKETYLMDAPTRNSDCIAWLGNRHPVTILARHADICGDYQWSYWSGSDGWAYIETVVDGEKVRGFIEPNCFSHYEIGDELINFDEVKPEKLKELYAFRYKVLKQDCISIDNGFVAGVHGDGTICMAGEDEYGRDVMKDWTNIIALSMCNGAALGLKSDGTVVAAGNNQFGQCDVESWTSIVAIGVGEYHSVGLKADGTVVMTGSTDFHQDSVKVWKDVVAIRAGAYYTAGLRSSDRVMIAGCVYDDESEMAWEKYKYDDPPILKQTGVEYWDLIREFDAHGINTVGVRADGRVVVSGESCSNQYEAQEWEDIRLVCASWNRLYGVDMNGNLYGTGYNEMQSGWQYVVCLEGCDKFVLGVEHDGEVLYAETYIYEDERQEYDRIKEAIDRWQSIGLPRDAEVFTF